MTLILLLVLGGLGSRWLVTVFRCRHLDADGHSVLLWRRQGEGETSRICGWCPQCNRVTAGWSFPGAKQP